MLDNFMNDPQANFRAVLVLIGLIASLVISLALTLRSAPVPTGKSWFTALTPVFALLGVPAAFDLLQTSGLTFFLAGVALAALVISIILSLLILFQKSPQGWVDIWKRWAIPLLVAGGIAVAGYLAFIESTAAQPVCGDVGDCGAVQDSPYAMLFGVLPVGMLGLAGYLGILVAWFGWQFGPQSLKKASALAVWGMCVFGIVFSIYLTYLEPFVIGASCMWCLTSAVLMILLLWVSTPAAQEALAIQTDDE